MSHPSPLCPKCELEMTFVMDGPKEAMTSSRDTINLPLASHIYACPEHGHWRVYISGAMKPFPRL